MNAALIEYNPLQIALGALGRAPEIPEAQDVYGWLVGSWELDVLHYWAKDVSAQGIKGELHAAWVLEGRAVQDVWIMPPRVDRVGQLDKKFNMYGTTLRIWDATLQAWRITWRNPAGEHREEQIGRRVGKEIIQTGIRPDGMVTRWRFTELTGDSFHWLGEAQAPSEKVWTLEGEFRGRLIN